MYTHIFMYINIHVYIHEYIHEYTYTYVYESYVNHVYVYMNLMYFAVHLKLTQHCKSIILQLKKRNEKSSILICDFSLKSYIAHS